MNTQIISALANFVPCQGRQFIKSIIGRRVQWTTNEKEAYLFKSKELSDFLQCEWLHWELNIDSIELS